MSVYEVEARAERGHNLTDGTSGDYVRIKYRREGERRWTKLLVIPEPDQSVDSLIREAQDIVVAHVRHEACA